MYKFKFKVGDNVKIKTNKESRPYSSGKTGKIIRTLNTKYQYVVKFPKSTFKTGIPMLDWERYKEPELKLVKNKNKLKHQIFNI